MASRKVNVLERKLHQAALADLNQTLTQKQIETLAPDATDRMNALNFLLGAGMFKALKDAKGVISFRVVTQTELNLKKDLGGEENLVLSHISAAGNEGIWSKYLKAKTELHKTVLDRCIKSLVKKQLIKPVKNVKAPTRKFYMLAHLEPSAEMTGGPWYTDSELDTEFINRLLSACLSFIRSKTLPKVKSEARPLFPISAAPSYPSAQHIQTFLAKSNITDTNLTVEHVEMLLNVLVIDGAIEKIPAFGSAFWGSNDDDRGSDDDDVDSANEDSSSKRKKRRHQADEPASKKRKTADQESDSDVDQGTSSRRLKKRKKPEADSDGSDASPQRRKKASKRGKHLSATDAESSTEDEHDASPPTRKKQRQRSTSPAAVLNPLDLGSFDGGAFVFRAIRQDRVALGWSQAPCSKCPVFDFCSSKGPVNPQECAYYNDWLGASTIQVS